MNYKSFTLIETLVSISIVFILLAILLPNYSLMRSRFALLQSAYMFAQDIRNAREMAISAKDFKGNIPAGYGVYLNFANDNTKYFLYADKDGNQEHSAGDEIVETISLGKNIYVQQEKSATLAINFKSPDPVVKITGGLSLDETAIVLTSKDNEKEHQTIIINRAGLVYVE